MNSKRRVEIDHCYKSKEKVENMHLAALLYKESKQDRKHALISIGHKPIYPSKCQLPSQRSIMKISVKFAEFYPCFGFYFQIFFCQSKDKMLLRFVLYSTMMVANIDLDKYANGQCQQVHVFHFASLLVIAMLASTCSLLCFLTFYTSS